MEENIASILFNVILKDCAGFSPKGNRSLPGKIMLYKDISQWVVDIFQ